MNCRICESTDIITYKYGGIGLINCKSCDINYLQDFPDSKSINNLYSENYNISSKDSDTELRRGVQQIENYHIINLIRQYYNSAKTIVDIGCDAGFFIDEARRNNFDVFGVELNQKAKNYCQNIGLKVESSIEAFNRKFDVITMNHSLEHFTNPKEYLDFIRDFIDKRGIIIIRVPAFDSISSKIFKSKWTWFQPENHYFHYTQKSLKYLLEKSGYKVLYQQKRNPSKWSHYFKYILARIEFSNAKLIRFNPRILITQIIKNVISSEILLIATIEPKN